MGCQEPDTSAAGSRVIPTKKVASWSLVLYRKPKYADEKLCYVLVTKQTGPVRKWMGHLITISSGGQGTVASKIEAMKIASTKVAGSLAAIGIAMLVAMGSEGDILNALNCRGV